MGNIRAEQQNILRKVISAFVFANISVLCNPHNTFAQITPDATLPNPSVVLGTPFITITGGTTANTNLFHSFSQFSVPSGGEAFFDNPLAIQNILVRVTGGTISNIDGFISNNGDANLFLINPNGIFFGQNAALNIGGSFLATTANSVRFLDGSEFRANASTQVISPLLLVSTPVGLQFNGLTNGAISISRSLVFVPTGRTLALVGGDVNMQEAGLFANSGRVELGSVAGNGFVAITQTANNLILNYNQVSNLGNVSLDQSAINVSGANFDGNIQLQGRQVTLDNSSVLGAILFSSGNGGEIFVRATEFLSVRDSTVFSLAVTPFLPGNGSNIIIDTNNLLLDGGQLLTDSDFNSIGNAGNIEITAKNVSLVSNDSLSRRSIISSGGIINFAGNSGDIKITTDNLLLTDGAAVTANSRGIGNGGVVDITAKSIFLDGSNSLFPSQIASSSFGDGNAGDVKISTESLVLKDGGQINVETESNKGNAGKISIRSNFIDIFGENSTYRSGLFANALVGSGSGGNIEVVNSDRLIVRDGGAISASNFDDRSRTSLITPGTGILGNITINSSSILLNQGNINIDSLGFSQGNINLNSSLILLRNGSKISTNALGSAAGGNITIKADFLTAIPFENSDITATAVSNFGGKVIVSAQGVFGFQFVERLTPLSDITASSPLGASQFNGLLESSATTTLIDNYDLTSINNLSVDNPQIVSACDRLRGNEFIITGRGGVPSDASKVISSQAIWRDLRLSEIPSTQSNITSQTETNLVTTQSTLPVAIQPIPQIEAQGWEKDGNGRLKLLAYATSPSDPVWRLPAVCPVNNVRN